MFNIIHNEAIIKIDFIVRKDTEYREAEFERRRCINFQGLTIYVTSPEDLILSKLELASESLSEMQLRDVRNLLMMPSLDRDYIKYWVERLGLSDIYKRTLE